MSWLFNFITVRSFVTKKRTMHRIFKAPLLENPYSLFLSINTDIWSNQMPDDDGDDTLSNVDADGDGDDDADDDGDGADSDGDGDDDAGDDPMSDADGDDDADDDGDGADSDGDGDDDADGDGDDDDGGCLPSSVSSAGTASSTHVL